MWECAADNDEPLRILRISASAASFPPDRISTDASRSRIWGTPRFQPSIHPAIAEITRTRKERYALVVVSSSGTRVEQYGSGRVWRLASCKMFSERRAQRNQDD